MTAASAFPARGEGPRLRVVEIVRPAPVPAGMVFWFFGRPIKVVQVYGPVAIVEELFDGTDYERGQLALWATDAVAKQAADPDFPRTVNADKRYWRI